VYVRDHLGSVRLVIDYPEGGVVERRDYGPFGEPLEQHGTFELQHQFTGQRHDASSGLEFFNARMLDRRWGRFISPDPLVAGLDAERLNRFSYVRNRPTSLVDPSGLCDVDDCITVVATPLLPRFAYVDGIALPLSAVPANAVLTGWVTGPYGAGTRIADSKLTAAELFGRENTAPPREDGSDGSHVDPQADLGAAYLVSRPLGFFRGASHNFVVTRAGFLGDPTARVYSYGETEAFFLGRVDESTVGFSAGTYEADVAAWLDLRGSSLPDRNALLIPASSRQVEAWAARLLEGYHDYSLFGGSAGPNSSTAAQAIANRAAGRSLPVPGSPRLAPGADSWRVIEFAPER
jgi:RHS repeat-associated protein